MSAVSVFFIRSGFSKYVCIVLRTVVPILGAVYMHTVTYNIELDSAVISLDTRDFCQHTGTFSQPCPAATPISPSPMLFLGDIGPPRTACMVKGRSAARSTPIRLSVSHATMKDTFCGKQFNVREEKMA